MKVEKYKRCSNCGTEDYHDYHCISCNAIGREKKIRFRFLIGWRRPTYEETKGVPLHERERIKVPIEPPFEER